MKRSIIYLAVALFVALAVVALENPFKSRIADNADDYLFPGFDVDNVARVEVEQLLDGCILEKKGDEWQVMEKVTPIKEELYKREGKEIPSNEWKKVDKKRITSALGNFVVLERGALVSDKPENQSTYQVGKTGLSVRVFDKDGKKLANVVIGKNGPDFASTYLRFDGENAVYLVGRPLMGAFSARFDDWTVKDENKDNEPPKEEQKVEVSK